MALTPAPHGEAADRFADFVLPPGGDEVWCVRERHSAGRDGAGGRITRAIVAIPLDGSGADDPAAIRILVSGSDFYAYPAPSPDGTRLAWICWDHPQMPWDGTELRVAALDGGEPVSDKHQQQLIMGCATESVLAPVWRDDRSLYVISDRSGWWNLYMADLLAFPRALCPREEEYASPLWQLGLSPYAVLGDGTQRKSYLYVQDCLSAMLHVMDTGTAKKAKHRVEVYNLGTDHYVQVNDSIGWIVSHLGLQPEISYTGGERGWIGDNPFIFLDTKRIRALGWKSKLSIRQGVLKTVEFLQNNPWVFVSR